MEERRYKSTRASSAKPDVSIKSLLKTTKDGPVAKEISRKNAARSTSKHGRDPSKEKKPHLVNAKHDCKYPIPSNKTRTRAEERKKRTRSQVMKERDPEDDCQNCGNLGGELEKCTLCSETFHPKCRGKPTRKNTEKVCSRCSEEFKQHELKCKK